MALKKAPAAAKSAAKSPKAAAPAKAAAPQATVTLKHLAAALSESHELPKKQADAMLSEMVGLVTKHLKKGDRLRLNGLGMLAGPQARRSHGPQPRHRRVDQDQGEQEGRLPRGQGTEGSRLTLYPLPCGRGTPVAWSNGGACDAICPALKTWFRSGQGVGVAITAGSDAGAGYCLDGGCGGD